MQEILPLYGTGNTNYIYLLTITNSYHLTVELNSLNTISVSYQLTAIGIISLFMIQLRDE